MTDPQHMTEAPTRTGLRRGPGGLDASAPPWRWIALIAVVGVLVRACLAWAAMPLDIQSDEANYIYVALGLDRFGLYLDQHRYFWPPAYPWLISQFLSPEGGVAGLDTLRGFQVLLSSVIGVTTMLFAWRLFSRRAAIVAGILWAAHLPLGAYTHFLWTETLFLSVFLPALWHLLMGMDRAADEDSSSANRRLLLSGVLFGVSLYVKELPLFLLPLIALLLFGHAIAEAAGPKEGLRRASLVPLAALVVILPWTLRNHEVYQRTIWSGATLGENVYIGLNARYMNFDQLPLRKVCALHDLTPPSEFRRKGFTDPPSSWVPSDVNQDGAINDLDAAWLRAEEHPHLIDRQDEQVKRGLSYAWSNPAWFVRTRLKKWSDLVAPVSFFTRHHALGKYPADGPLGGPLRGPAVIVAAVMSGGVLLLGLAGLCFTLPSGRGRHLLGLLLGYTVLTSTLVAMSRFRVPVEPFLLVLAGGFLAHGWAGRGSVRTSAVRVALFGTLALAVVGLWWLSWPETMMQLKMAMTGPGGAA